MKTRKIIFLIYPGFELLDLSGPVSVFSTANALCKKQTDQKSPYKIHTVSADGGLIASSSSVEVSSEAANSVEVTKQTTVLVVGSDSSGINVASSNLVIQTWLKKHCKHTQRFGSICSGTFILAAAGLLDHRIATTHWAGCKQLEKMYPAVEVKPESLYVVDGNLWTSAGVTTGLDMALEMLSRDLGKAIMSRVAKRLVVYAHRPGNQSQFSTLLRLQAGASSGFSELLSWIDGKLDQPIKVEDMASLMCMSERTFYRKFTATMGITPSKYVEESKLNLAKSLIEENQSVSQVSAAVGFKSETAFRTRFESRFGLTPAMHKRLHAAKEG